MDNIISVYTRQQAIDDGIFVDVSVEAKYAGFKIPVAVTTNLFHTHIEKQEEYETARCLNAFLRMMLQGICNHKDKNTESLLSIPIEFEKGKFTNVWAAIEAQSPSDSSPALNFLLPEDY